MLIELSEGDLIKLKGGNKNLFRMLYAYEGDTFSIDGDNYKENSVFKLIFNENITLKSIKSTNKFLLLEGMPIDEPVYAYGPFVMNTRDEVMEAYKDYNETEFGGWPFPVSDPVHDKKQGRFAKFSDGKIELP